MSIRSFKSKALKDLFVKGRVKRLGPQFCKGVIKILDRLNNIEDLSDCKGVKNFHELKGARKGTYSMHVNGNYCITFRWDGWNVEEVDLEDYHMS